MAAGDAALRVDAQPGKHVAAETFDQSHPLADLAGLTERAARCAVGQPFDDLLDEAEALLDLADAHPDAGVHIAIFARRHLEAELVVRRIGKHFTRVEAAARGPADISPSTERPRQLRAEITGRHRAVLQRGGVVVDLDELREAVPRRLDQRAQWPIPSAARSQATPPGTTRSIISRWPKQACAVRKSVRAECRTR